MTNGFRDIAKQNPVDDGFAKLLCTIPGCGHRWAVTVERPLCSLHAGKQTTKYFSFAFTSLTNDKNLDGRLWARRIIAAHEAGNNVRPLSLALAKDSLPLQQKANQQKVAA